MNRREGPYVCPECYVGCPSQEDLDRHMSLRGFHQEYRKGIDLRPRWLWLLLALWVVALYLEGTAW